MHTYVLQDWTTIRGTGTATSITQGEQGWLELTPFQDVFFWIDVREASGMTVTIDFQTSPNEDETLFTPIVTMPAATLTLIVGTLTLVKAPMLSALVPVARFLRWNLTGTGTPWDATFRVVVAANSPGL
jgi:hypothetical protein